MKMFIEERRQHIMEYLMKHQRATVKELAEILNVSEATLRSDLNEMETAGLLQRTHGGATLPDSPRPDPITSFSEREKINREEKVAIGKYASELVHTGQCILLDASSTALEMARILKKRQIRLTVLTNGIYTAMELQENPGFTVILVGGVLRMGTVALEGSLGNAILKQIHVDTMFTSASGFTFEDGLTDFNVYEVELKRSMVTSSSRVIALLDHTKIGKSSIASFATPNQVDMIITDSQISPDAYEQLRKLNINVIIADSSTHKAL